MRCQHRIARQRPLSSVRIGARIVETFPTSAPVIAGERSFSFSFRPDGRSHATLGGYLTVVKFFGPIFEDRIVLPAGDPWPWEHVDTFLIDDGASVVPWYCAGWSPSDDAPAFYLNAFPTNPDGRVRPDNGRPVDYSSWLRASTRAWHLKIR